VTAAGRIPRGRSAPVCHSGRGGPAGGVYSKLRHPIHVFGSLSLLGSFVALQAPGALAAWVIIVVAEAAKARREERVLAGAFGTEYLEYKRRTWF
jgi:protein-S-isoprenylcysteine O-methyltransferase Ste14